MIIGSHCSLNGDEMFLGSVKEAISYNANALMVYTGAPQSTQRKDISELRIKEAHALMKENGISLDNLVIHAPYIINPATSDFEKRRFCIDFLSEEIRRSNAMGAKTIVLHPGNSLDLDRKDAIKNIAFVVNACIENTLDCETIIALETMAGKGSEVGKTFEEIKEIIDLIDHKERIGVCLDTCHINDGGYDLVNKYDEVFRDFRNIVGLDYLKVIHLNDSKNPLDSHKDRHANIGEGFIGLTTLKRVAEDKLFESIPKILETPYIDGRPPYKEEIKLIRGY